MDSRRGLYKVLNKSNVGILVIADNPTQAIDLAAIPRPGEEAHIKAQEAVVVSNYPDYTGRGIDRLLATGEIGEIYFSEEQDLWVWKSPFYVLEFKYHGPFVSNETAAQYAVNSGLPENSRVLRMDE